MTDRFIRTSIETAQQTRAIETQQLNPLEACMQAEEASVLSDVIGTLKPVERLIVTGYFIYGEKLSAMSEFLGVTRQRVYQIKDKALRKLRHPERSAKLLEACL